MRNAQTHCHLLLQWGAVKPRCLQQHWVDMRPFNHRVPDGLSKELLHGSFLKYRCPKIIYFDMMFMYFPLYTSFSQLAFNTPVSE